MTTSLAVKYLDRFLGANVYDVQPIQGWIYHLVANACQTIAVKFQVRHVLYATCHMSRVICHVLHDTYCVNCTSCFMPRVVLPAPRTLHPTTLGNNTWHPVPCILYHASCALSPAPCTPHLAQRITAPCTLHPAPCDSHPALCALHPTHPTLFTLHSSPCTLHPALYTLRPTLRTLYPEPAPCNLHPATRTPHPAPRTPPNIRNRAPYNHHSISFRRYYPSPSSAIP